MTAAGNAMNRPGMALRRASRSRSFAGIISLLAFVALVVDLVWLIMAGELFLLQLPILLGTLFILMFFGLGYIINPPAWTGAFFMALLYFAQDFTLRQGLVGGGGVDLQSIVKGGIAALLMSYGLFNGFKRCSHHVVLMLFLAYALFAAGSASYSSARALGIGSGIALLGIAFATARGATLTQKDLSLYWDALYITAVVVCLSSFALLATVPLMARDLADPGAYRMRGITGSANSLGPIMAAGAIMGLGVIRRQTVAWKKNMHRLFWLAMVAALVLTNSRSSWLGLALGLAICAVLARKQNILTILLLLFGASVGMAVLLLPSLAKEVMTLFVELFSRSGNVQELTSFTGRSDIWAACWKLIVAKPMLGYGLGSVRIEIPKVFWDSWGNTAATAHNFVLESMISVGLVGTTLLLMVVLTTTVGLARMVSHNALFHDERQRDLALCALRCMMMLLIHAMVERAFAGMAAPSTVLLGVCVATYVFFALQRNVVRDERLARIRRLS